ncbi:hypothetical protein Tco_0312534, partial [Tanacetum coccineum]
NEALNGGGKLFVEKLPDVKVHVVHGNKLTATFILNEIPKDIGEVFMTRAKSKLGRAIVPSWTSTADFEVPLKEADLVLMKYLLSIQQEQHLRDQKVEVKEWR